MEPTRLAVRAGEAKARSYTLILALITTTVCAFCWWYPGWMGLAGVGHGGVWFRDIQAVLAAIEAHRHGMDPYGVNAYNAQHFYSHWWFWFEPTGWTRRDAAWLGLVLGGLTLLSTWLVTRPRRAAEVIWILLIFCSAPVLLGLNRANVDLLLFALLSLCVPALLSHVRFWRIAGAPGLIALATGLKYYPSVGALILLAIRPGRDRTPALILSAGLFALTAWSIAPDLTHYVGVVDHEGFYVFGASASLRKIGITTPLAPAGACLFLLLTGGWIARRTSLQSWSAPAGLRTEYLNFILAATILTGCFLATANYAYRWIFALWMIPFLCRAGGPPASALHRLRTLTRGLLVMQVWVESLVVVGLSLFPPSQTALQRWETATTTGLSALTWALFACLSGWLIHFVFTQYWIPPGAPARD